MKHNLISKRTIGAAFLLTFVFSCKKDVLYLPAHNSDFGSSQMNEVAATDQPVTEASLAAASPIPGSANPGVAPTNPVVVNVNPTDWKLFQKSPIAFKPFPMVGKDGATIRPFAPIVLPNGKSIQASEYFARLNYTEKALNAQGYTIRNSATEKISAYVTPREFLEDMVAKHVKPIGVLRTETQLASLMSTTRQVGSIVMKPESEYTAAEKNALRNVFFESQGDNVIAKIRNFQSGEAAPIPGEAVIVNPKALKTINETSSEEWSIGKQSIIKAGVKGELIRQASIYQFNPQSPGTSMSSFRVIGKGNVFGYLFGKRFNLLEAEADFFAPADTAKKMTGRIKAEAAGITMVNFNESYPQKKTVSENSSKVINQSLPIDGIPIGGGLSFTGKIGVKGSVGLKYNATLGRGYVTASVTPSANISAYAEAGVEFLGFLGGGVGGDLTFVQGNMDLRGSLFMALRNAEQIVIGYSHYFGVDLTLLKGRLYVYGEACVPYTDLCKRWQHDIFNWDGVRAKGTISEGSKMIPIVNF